MNAQALKKEYEYTQVVLNQHSSYDSRTIPYRRGDIVDRNGTYLATSEKVYNLIIDPNQINKASAEYPCSKRVVVSPGCSSVTNA